MHFDIEIKNDVDIHCLILAVAECLDLKAYVDVVCKGSDIHINSKSAKVILDYTRVTGDFKFRVSIDTINKSTQDNNNQEMANNFLKRLAQKLNSIVFIEQFDTLADVGYLIYPTGNIENVAFDILYKEGVGSINIISVLNK